MPVTPRRPGDHPPPPLTFGVLGAVEIRAGDEVVELRRAKQIALLATLLLSANQVVSPTRLIDAIWGEDPPTSARALVQNYVSALRGLARVSTSIERSAPRALAHLAGFPLRRMPLAPLLERIWRLRANVTAYDAAYIALAEQLNCALITCDVKLASASGPRCPIDLIT